VTVLVDAGKNGIECKEEGGRDTFVLMRSGQEEEALIFVFVCCLICVSVASSRSQLFVENSSLRFCNE